MEHLQEDWNQMTTQTDRIVTSPRGKVRNAHSGKSSRRESRAERKQKPPVSEGVVRSTLEKYLEQFDGQPYAWKHPRRGANGYARAQVVNLVMLYDLVDNKGLRPRQKNDMAKRVADAIIDNHLLTAVPYEGSKKEVVYEITAEGLSFLQGTSLQEICQLRAAQQALRAKQAASLAKKSSAMSFIGFKAHKAGHPTMHDPTPTEKKVSVGA